MENHKQHHQSKHVHEHHHELSGRNLFFTIILNSLITILQIIGGIVSGSMALIADAVHNFSDVLSLIISYVANKLSKKNATTKQTFGFKRSEIIAAFINSATLIVVAIIILNEAIRRFFEKIEISPNIVIWLSLVGIVANGLSVLFIKKDSEDNMNIKSAYIHLFSDMLTSVAVLVGGLTMKYLNWFGIDAILSVLISIYLIYLSLNIFKNSLKILMQFVPNGIEIEEIKHEIEEIEGIKNIHHIHIWQLNEHEIIFEAHVDLKEDVKISDFEKILETIKHELEHFNVFHSTIQPEFCTNDCKELIN